jgi:undecaprenyl phosphate N,N'-diacetylbacillosamine 1-phosphate transferase
MGSSMRQLQDKFKRLLDIAVSGAGLTATAPVLFGIAAAIKLDSPGPVLFRQRRLGRGGRVFEILKFRTMCNDADVVIGEDNTVVNPTGDDRVTRVGKILRATSLDELPQLVNVLVGEMSLVGPRPDLPEAIKMYQCEESRKLDVRPGITGLSQVSGRNLLDANDKWRIDASYARDAGLSLDMRILAQTFIKVVMREGIYRTERSKNE